MSYKLVVKDGSSRYVYDQAKGQYTHKEEDFVEPSESLAEALMGFLEWVTDEELDSRVTLTYKPEKKAKKK